MDEMNGLGPVVDLGEIHRRQREKEQVPPYSIGKPEFVMQVAVQPVNGQLSFRDAIERAALILGSDGFAIDEVKQCAFAGVDQGNNAIFQVVVVAAEVPD